MKRLVELKQLNVTIKMGRINGKKFIKVNDSEPIFVNDYVTGLAEVLA